MASAMDSEYSGLVWGTALCSWARHFALIVPLFNQVYKWVPANLLWEVLLGWTSVPSRGSKILLVASCLGNRRVKLQH